MRYEEHLDDFIREAKSNAQFPMPKEHYAKYMSVDSLPEPVLNTLYRLFVAAHWAAHLAYERQYPQCLDLIEQVVEINVFLAGEGGDGALATVDDTGEALDDCQVAYTGLRTILEERTVEENGRTLFKYLEYVEAMFLNKFWAQWKRDVLLSKYAPKF